MVRNIQQYNSDLTPYYRSIFTFFNYKKKIKMFNSFTPKLFQLHWKITGIQIFTTLE